MLPTDGCILWTTSVTLHRSAELWPNPHTFQPERFLPENASKLVPDAYRPFEKGQRNCIGQELALLELKIVLALTVREFHVGAAFDELETLCGDGSLWDNASGKDEGPRTCFGDEMYQVLIVAAKPREGMPARVTRRRSK